VYCSDYWTSELITRSIWSHEGFEFEPSTADIVQNNPHSNCTGGRAGDGKWRWNDRPSLPEAALLFYVCDQLSQFEPLAGNVV